MTTVAVGIIGFGWMGQAHARSYLRIPTLFPDAGVASSGAWEDVETASA
jgi:predicted dehydrogenase